MLDQLDNLVESEVISENVEYFEHGAAAGARPVEETAGIPTGTDPDLAAAIERRRARSRKGQQPQKAPPAPKPVAVSSSVQSPVQQQTRGLAPVLGSDMIQVSQPQHSQGYQQAEQATSGLSPSSPRRRTALPDNLVITDLSQPDDLPDQSISMQPSPSQQATPLHAAATQAQPADGQQGIPLIKSLDDPAFAALPSGAQFVTPDGKKRWKK